MAPGAARHRNTRPASAKELPPDSRLRRPRPHRRRGFRDAQPPDRPEEAGKADRRQPPPGRALRVGDPGRSDEGFQIRRQLLPGGDAVHLLYPVGVVMKGADSVFVLGELITFVVLLMLAFLYVWRKGALDWK